MAKSSNATEVDFDTYKKALSGLDSKREQVIYAKWHVLAEGDSWFHFNRSPFKGPQENLLKTLEFKKSAVIVNMAMSGDNVAQMMNPNIPGFFNASRVATFKSALEYRKWDMILLSACGNDLIDAFDGGYDIGTRKVKIIQACDNPTSFTDYLNLADLDDALESIKDSYSNLISIIRNAGGKKNDTTKIIGHTYDYFTLRNIKSKGKSKRQIALEKHGVPPTYWKQITGYLNDRLRGLLLSFNGANVVIVDTMDTLNPADQDEPENTRHWRNEIHPNFDGYSKIARERVNKYLEP